MTKKNSMIFFVVTVVSIIVSSVFYDKHLDKQAQRNYAIVYNSALNGELDYLTDIIDLTPSPHLP